MSFTQPGLFELSPPIPRPVTAGPQGKSQSQWEQRRRVLAEERTGEIVMLVSGMGYVALSEVYYQPVDAGGSDTGNDDLTVGPSFYQFELL